MSKKTAHVSLLCCSDSCVWNLQAGPTSARGKAQDSGVCGPGPLRLPGVSLCLQQGKAQGE